MFLRQFPRAAFFSCMLQELCPKQLDVKTGHLAFAANIGRSGLRAFADRCVDRGLTKLRNAGEL